MTVFYQEKPPHTSKRCRCKFLKDALAKCHSFRGKLSVSSFESDEPVSDFDQEEEVFVSAIISKYMESKSKRKHTSVFDSFRWALSPETAAFAAIKRQGSCGENTDEFYSAGSHLSRCSSANSLDAFFSAKTRFSRSSSLNRIDFQELRNRAILMEVCHCEGWPFGLCRKVVLLPPLPDSPANSWSWRKSGRTIKIHI